MSSTPNFRRRSLGRIAVLRGRLRAGDGFTLVETLVATVVLVIGLVGSFALLDVTVHASAATRAREGAVTLAREITEDARSIPFSQLAPSTIVDQLQGMPGLASTSPGPTWQIVRRGVTYTVQATECSIDDSKDGYGQHDSTFCADSTVPPGTTLTDSNPVDLKRVTATVTWTVLNRTHSYQEVATMTSAGEAAGLVATGLAVASPASLANQTAPTITSTSITQLTFSVTAPTGTTAIVWTVDGVAQSWSTTSSGTTWTSSTPWVITGLSDGSYQIGAAAENANGVIGPAVTIPVVLSRSIPAAPDVTRYGFNTNLSVSGTKTTVAEFQWEPNTERNVTGYRIYGPSNTQICNTTNSTSYASCGASAWCSSPTACIDLAAPAPTAANLTYRVAALYRDATGTLQEGPSTSVTLTGTPSQTYTFAPSTQNVDANCSGTTQDDMLATYTPGADSTQSGSQVTFCSDGFSSGDSIEAGGTATAYLANPASASCPVSATLSVDGNTSGALTSSNTLPARSAVTKYTFAFSSNQLLTMNAGDRLNLTFNLAGTGCGTGASASVLHFGSSTDPSLFTTPPTPIDVPNPPPSLTVTPQPDGTAVLTWPVPSGGALVSLYRVYRDGPDYPNRYDVVPTTECVSGTCTYSDGKRTGPHTYYVTAVGDDTPGSNMAESTATGPATG